MATDTDQAEVRRTGECGSTFWVRRCGAAWKLTADGTHIWGPGTHEEAMRQLDGVCPKKEMSQ